MPEPPRYHEFRDRAAWRAWLAAHHATASEAWVVHRKHGAALDLIALAEGVEEALCYGWIDGRVQPIDALRYALRYTPRRPRSVWSARNVARVERLTRMGRMADAGLAAAAAARRDGRWAAARTRARAQVPADLAAVLAAAGLRGSFDALAKSTRQRYLFWLESAARAATRTRRIARIVAAVRSDAAP